MEQIYARRSVNLAIVSLALAFVALIMAACASPADVTASHERQVVSLQEDLRNAQHALDHADVGYRDELATAREWDQHFMSIPAVGWVIILVFASIFLFVLLMFVIYFGASALKDRRAKQHALDVEREKTIRSRAERGACTVCGSEPLSAEDRKRLGESA